MRATTCPTHLLNTGDRPVTQIIKVHSDPTQLPSQGLKPQQQSCTPTCPSHSSAPGRGFGLGLLVLLVALLQLLHAGHGQLAGPNEGVDEVHLRDQFEQVTLPGDDLRPAGQQLHGLTGSLPLLDRSCSGSGWWCPKRVLCEGCGVCNDTAATQGMNPTGCWHLRR